MSILYNCLEATRLISKGQHVKLSLKDRLTLNMHIAMCNCCKSFQKDMNFLKEKISQMDDNQTHQLDPKVKENMSQKLIIALNK